MARNRERKKEIQADREIEKKRERAKVVGCTIGRERDTTRYRDIEKERQRAKVVGCAIGREIYIQPDTERLRKRESKGCLVCHSEREINKQT
jgi:hypothetical protein